MDPAEIIAAMFAPPPPDPYQWHVEIAPTAARPGVRVVDHERSVRIDYHAAVTERGGPPASWEELPQPSLLVAAPPPAVGRLLNRHDHVLLVLAERVRELEAEAAEARARVVFGAPAPPAWTLANGVTIAFATPDRDAAPYAGVTPPAAASARLYRAGDRVRLHDRATDWNAGTYSVPVGAVGVVGVVTRNNDADGWVGVDFGIDFAPGGLLPQVVRAVDLDVVREQPPHVTIVDAPRPDDDVPF